MEDKSTMDYKQSLKRQRIRTYFLDAAKEMVANEGVEHISVRKVADVAGYSYATLYNYFEDINDLLGAVKQAMIKDLVEWIHKRVSTVSLDMDGLKRLFRVYMEYYFENPNVFKFFYFYRLVQPSIRSEEAETEPDFDGMMRETFKGFVSAGKLKEGDIEAVGKTCIYAVHGMLTLYFSGNGNLTEELVFKELDKILDYLI